MCSSCSWYRERFAGGLEDLCHFEPRVDGGLDGLRELLYVA